MTNMSQEVLELVGWGLPIYKVSYDLKTNKPVSKRNIET